MPAKKILAWVESIFVRGEAVNLEVEIVSGRDLGLEPETDGPAKFSDEDLDRLVLGEVERKSGWVPPADNVALRLGPVVEDLQTKQVQVYI